MVCKSYVTGPPSLPFQYLLLSFPFTCPPLTSLISSYCTIDKRNQTQKALYCTIDLCDILEKQTIGIETRSVVARAWGGIGHKLS